MDIVFWLAIVAIVAVLFFKMKGGMKDTAATTNALLAEHYLELVELVPENPFSRELRDRIVSVLQSGSGMDSVRAMEMFNRSSRFHQLNVVALAINELRHSPLIPGEVWHEISNPFIVSEDTPHLEASAHRLSGKVGKQIHLKEYPMKITELAVLDTGE